MAAKCSDKLLSQLLLLLRLIVNLPHVNLLRICQLVGKDLPKFSHHGAREDGTDTEKDQKFPLALFLIVKSSANILRDLRHSLVQ